MPDSNGLVQSEAINQTKGRHTRSMSNFKNLSYRNPHTERFGEYTPTFIMEGVPNDKSVSVNSSDSIDSFTLKAPFKGSIRKVKESFKVPNMAILPMNWDLIYTMPSNGDDVPDDANCTLEFFPENMKNFWLSMYNTLGTAFAAIDPNTGQASDVADALTAIMRVCTIGEYIYSKGSLLNLSGYKHTAAMWNYVNVLPDGSTNPQGHSFDRWYDALLTLVFSNIVKFELIEPVGSGTLSYNVEGLAPYTAPPGGLPFNVFRFMLEKFRENPNCYFGTNITLAGSLASILGIIKNLGSSQTGYGMFYPGMVNIMLANSGGSGVDPEDFTDMSVQNLNLSRLLAYQLVCAHFYTNSNIDFIYSADLYRQYVHSFWVNQSPSYVERTFTRNGTKLPYDYLSESYLARCLYKYASATSYAPSSAPVQLTYAQINGINTHANLRFATFAAIFGFRKSLRFGDYFVGSRPRPLAPINTDVSVSSNKVSVIDITRNIQAQRFANSVMRSRQKIEEYVQDLFGQRPAIDWHNPLFLSREEEMVFGDEVQNTGDAQMLLSNSRTSNFQNNAGRFTFTFDAKDAHPCIYLQIVSYDVKRCYTKSVDRQMLELTRFDMFNPDFQYIGDQPIYGIELGYPQGSTLPARFAYTSRDMEYKQRFDVASGGFIENLPGWIMQDNLRDHLQPGVLSPDFIRSFNTELDQFYLSQTGFALGNYYHFAVITNNVVSAVRPMAVDPQILE